MTNTQEANQITKRPVNLHVLTEPSHTLPSILDLLHLTYQQVHYLISLSEHQITLLSLPSYNQLYQKNTSSTLHKIKRVQEKYLISTKNNTLLQFYPTTGELKTVLSGFMIWDFIEFNENLIIGCEDGAIRGYDDEFMLQGQTRNYEEKRVLSLVHNGTHFWAGYQNGMVRAFDKNFDNTLTISVREVQKCFVWTMAIFEDELICGCSDGSVKVFETKFGTGVKHLKTHQADVTCLATSDKGVYATGIDSKIAFLQKLAGEWQVSCYDRGQSHDINSLILLKDNVLLSGGLSTDIAVYKLQQGGRFQERHVQKEDHLKTKKIRHIVSLPQQSIFKFATSLRNKIMFLHQELHSVQLIMVEDGVYQNLVEINVNEQVINCCALNQNSNVLAYSTQDESKVLVVKPDLTLEKVHNFEPAQLMAFKDNYLYYVGQDCGFYCLNLVTQEKEKISSLDKAIYTHIEINQDYVVIGSKFLNRIIVFTQNQLHHTIPQIQGYLHCFMNFKLQNKYLYIVYDNNKFLIFDLAQKQLTNWSSQNLNKYPLYYIQHFNIFTDIIPLPNHKVLLYCPFFYTVIDHSKPVPSETELDTKDNRTARDWQLVRREKPIMSIQQYNNEMVLIENDWSALMKSVPGAVNTRNYGM